MSSERSSIQLAYVSHVRVYIGCWTGVISLGSPWSCSPPWDTRGYGAYKYIHHPALTKLVTPTCVSLCSSYNLKVEDPSSCTCPRGEQSYRCGIMGHNILSSQTAIQKGKRNITVCLSEKGRPDGHLDRRGGCWTRTSSGNKARKSYLTFFYFLSWSY